MKYITTLILMIFVSTLLFATESFAQRGMGWRASKGWGSGGPCCTMYSPETAETISGEVVSVDKIMRGKGTFYGVHLTVKTDKETLPVHLGPGWYIESQDTKIEPKDKVEIKGSRIIFNGKPAIIAYEVKKGEEILVLRDENGFPAWRGWRLRSDVQPSTQQGMRWKGSGGWGPKTNYGRMYNPETVETVSGEVVSIEKITPGKGMYYGIHLTVKTDKETISVHLGPGWFIENQSITIEPEDKIEVKGSRVSFEGKPAIIAAEVNKGEEILALRDENGFPAWSGWRRR
ncbi:MAG: hypothetical protein ACYSR0_06045 [Planctomycetota bacterium]|jgi:hypothetical protein